MIYFYKYNIFGTLLLHIKIFIFHLFKIVNTPEGTE